MENQNQVDNNENLQAEPEVPTIMQITEDMRSYLYDAARWTRFLAVVGMIAAVFSVFTGFSVASLISSGHEISGAIASMAPQAIVFMFVFYAIIMFSMSLILFRFSQKTMVGVLYMHPDSIREGLKNLKNFFKFQGILVIVILGIYLLAIISVLAGM